MNCIRPKLKNFLKIPEIQMLYPISSKNVFLHLTFVSLIIGAVFLVNSWVMPVNNLAAHKKDSQVAVANRPAHFGHLPLSFEANQGQTDARVKFLSRGNGYSLMLTPTEAILDLRQSRKIASAPKLQRDVLRMELIGANPTPKITGVDQLAGKSNYFIGNNAAQTNIANYGKVRYNEVYPGIDLIWYGNQRQLEYDWVVASGADPRQIKMKFSGSAKPRLAENGDLILKTGTSEIRQHKPVIYQEINGVRQIVAGNYALREKGQTGFEMAEYDASQPLVIDPVLNFSTYFGGNNQVEDVAMALDSDGNIYVGGVTNSTNFPTKNGGQSTYNGAGIDGLGDGFVAKFTPDGSSLIFATYLGGSRDDEVFGIAIGPDKSIYLTGDTSSTNFPLQNPLQSSFSTALTDSYHSFVTKMATDGSALIYSTYLGGSGDADYASGIAVDSSGNAYITGVTNSTNFPIANALFPTFRGGTGDVFVAKINATGSTLLFSTFMGGSSLDEGGNIAVDDNNVYIEGVTLSSNFPVQNAVQSSYGGAGSDGYGDGFVTKLSNDGSALIFSTYLGGSSDDEIFSLALGPNGTIYLAGDTSSTNFPLKNALQSNVSVPFLEPYHGFVTKLNSDGSMNYSTYLGGSTVSAIPNDGVIDAATGIAVDIVGNAYVVGETRAQNFPVVNALQSTYSGGSITGFVTKINASGSQLLYSTYLGGSSGDICSDIRVDAIGNVVVVGITASTNFPVSNAFQSSNRGLTNLFLTRLGADEVTVSGANYSGNSITAKGIVSAFGPALATTTAPAPSVPLPTTLAGTTVTVTDSAGTDRLAPLFFVSSGQINYQIPAGTLAGPAAVTITDSNGKISSGVMQVVAVAPSIFTLSQDGKGAAAALDAITFAGAPFNAKRGTGEPNIIALFGTGLGTDVTDADGDVSASVVIKIDDAPATVLYAGRSPGYVGLNQYNALLPANINSGTHSVVVSRNGISSNLSTIAIK